MQSGSFPIVRSSADGSTWTDVQDGNDIAHAEIREIVGRNETLYAIGRDRGSAQSGLTTPDAWTYTERDGWTVLPNRFDRAAIGGLVADATGMYAAGIVLRDPDTRLVTQGLGAVNFAVGQENTFGFWQRLKPT